MPEFIYLDDILDPLTKEQQKAKTLGDEIKSRIVEYLIAKDQIDSLSAEKRVKIDIGNNYISVSLFKEPADSNLFRTVTTDELLGARSLKSLEAKRVYIDMPGEVEEDDIKEMIKESVVKILPKDSV